MSLMAALKAQKEKKLNSPKDKSGGVANEPSSVDDVTSTPTKLASKSKSLTTGGGVSSSKSPSKSGGIPISKNLKPVFQKLTVGHGKILLSQGDMKSLGIKPGSLVSVSPSASNATSNATSNAYANAADMETSAVYAQVLLAAWAREDVPVGSVLIPYIWNANFYSNNSSSKHDKFVCLSTDVSAIRLRTCTELNLSLPLDLNPSLSSEHRDALMQNSSYLSYVSSLLQSVHLQPGLFFSCTWYGAMLRLRIARAGSAGGLVGCSSDGEGEGGVSMQYRVTAQTGVNFNDTTSASASGSGSGSGSGSVSVFDIDGKRTSSAVSTSGQFPIGRDDLSFYGFAGYPDIVAEALKCVSFSLPAGAGAGHRSMLRPPKGLLIHGASGVGKTKFIHALTRHLVEECAGVFNVAHVPSTLLLSKYVGDAERTLQGIFTQTGADAVKGRSRTLVIIDDVDVLCPSRQASGTTETQKRIVTCLLTLMDGITQYTGSDATAVENSRVFVIAATSKPNALDAALRRPGRFDLELEIPVPSAEQRVAILTGVLSAMGCTPVNAESEGVRGGDTCVGLTRREVKVVAASAHGLVGADILQLCKCAATCAHRRVLATHQTYSGTGTTDTVSSLASQLSSLSVQELPLSPSEYCLQKQDLVAALRQVTPSALREVVVEVPTVHWSDIGGMAAVKQSLQEVVEWPLLYSSTFEALGLSCPKGVLLYGPPGCSKTLMAKAVATESAMNFLAVRGPELLSKYLGESEKAVQALFKRARAAAPSIVFFDEIDALASARGSSNTGVNDRVLSQLLVELDGSSGYGGGAARVVVIAATNRPDMLDPALLRPGRIDRKIYVSPPDDTSRLQIFEGQLIHGKLSNRVRLDESLDELVQLTEGFSGAEIVACCTEAAISVVNRVLEREEQQEQEQHADSADFLTMGDIKLAIGGIKPQITPEMLSYYETFAEQNVV